MRVITGKARGVVLKTPDGMTTRPTTDRVKEAMFSIIQFDIPGARVLDLFGGTGQLGIEALSRGARSCVFVDMNRNACRIIRENLQRWCDENPESNVWLEFNAPDPVYNSGAKKDPKKLSGDEDIIINYYI